MNKTQTRLKQLFQTSKAGYGNDIGAFTSTGLLTMLAFFLSGCGGGGGGGGGGGSSSSTSTSTSTTDVVIPTVNPQDSSSTDAGDIIFQLLRSGDYNTGLILNKAISQATFSANNTTNPNEAYASDTTNDGDYNITATAGNQVVSNVSFSANSIDYKTGVNVFNTLKADISSISDGTHYISELSTLAANANINNLQTKANFATKFANTSLSGTEDITTVSPTDTLLKLNMQITCIKQFMKTWLTTNNIVTDSAVAEATANSAFESFINDNNAINFSDTTQLGNLRDKLQEQSGQTIPDKFFEDAITLMNLIPSDLTNLSDPLQDKINMYANNQEIAINFKLNPLLTDWPETTGTVYTGELWVTDGRTIAELDGSHLGLIGLDLSLSSSNITFIEGTASIESILPMNNLTTISNNGNTLQLRGQSLPNSGQGDYIGDETLGERFASFNFTLDNANPNLSITINDSELGNADLFYFDVDWT